VHANASSGNDALDRLLGGGLGRGTSTLVMGPPGTGKSTLAAHFATAAAQRGEKVAIYTFDEKLETYKQRADSLSINISDYISSGHIAAAQINPAELSPGEFAHRIRRAVEEHGVRCVIIDSLNGYLNSMSEE